MHPSFVGFRTIGLWVWFAELQSVNGKIAKISLNVLPYEIYTPPLPGIVATALLIITNSFKLSNKPYG